MGFETRFQLVDLGVLPDLMAALCRGDAPPPSAFDRAPGAGELWERAKAARRGEDVSTAVRVACSLAVQWSAATLPSVTLRNIALTHEPIRMPDVYRPLGDLRGIDHPVEMLSALGFEPETERHFPTRLDSGADTGAFVRAPGVAGEDLARFIRGIQVGDRGQPAKLLALLRAAERSDLCVWEALDFGGSRPGVANARWALSWPHLAQDSPDRFALAGPLTEAEWQRVDGAWHRGSLGDLDDLVTQVTWVDPADKLLVPHALRALGSTFVRDGSRPPRTDELLPRALDWLERAVTTLEFQVAAARVHNQLMQCFSERTDRAPLPQEVLDSVARSAVGALSPTQLASETAAIYERHRAAKPIQPEIAGALVERWHALFHLAPERAMPNKISDYVLQDSSPYGLLLRRLEGPPSPALVKLVLGLFDAAIDDSNPGSVFHQTVLERSTWLWSLAGGADDGVGAPLHRRLSKHAVWVLQRLADGEPLPEHVAARVVGLWHALFLHSPSAAISVRLGHDCDSVPFAGMLHRLDGPPSLDLGRMAAALFDRSGRVDELRDDASAMVRATRDRREWLRALISAIPALGDPSLAAKLDAEVTKWCAQTAA